MRSEGRFYAVVTAIGHMVLLSILWFVGSLFVVTIGTSTTALYYSIVKTVRKERSYPAREFMKAYKDNFWKGTLATIVGMALLAILAINLRYMSVQEEKYALLMMVVYYGLLLVVIAVILYLFPVMSRFRLPFGKLVAMSFVMAIGNIHYTLLMMLGLGGLWYLQYRFLPIPMILLMPGLSGYLSSFVLEKVMHRYIPPALQQDDGWNAPELQIDHDSEDSL